MGGAVGPGETAAAGGILGRSPEVAPAPGLGPEDLRARVAALDLRRRRQPLRPDLVVAGRRGMDVAVRAVPEHRLVVEVVEAHAGGRGGAEAGHQMAGE